MEEDVKLHNNHTNNFAKIEINWFTLNLIFTQITTRQTSPDFIYSQFVTYRNYTSIFYLYTFQHMS